MAEPTMTDETLRNLRRPFTPEALKWKVQANLSNNRGLCVAYIDARLVAERLNAVVGMGWFDSYRPYGDRIDSGLMWCDLTVGGVTRSDVGEGHGKGLTSDAFKRAGVRFGVGVPNYAVPQAILASSSEATENGKPTLRRVEKKGKQILYITPACDEWLADHYRAWLKKSGIAAFGEPLDHGDVAGSVGDPVDVASEEPEQENLELAAKRQEAEALYAEVTADDTAKRRKLPLGRFKAELESRETAEAVDELIEKVRAL